MWHCLQYRISSASHKKIKITSSGIGSVNKLSNSNMSNFQKSMNKLKSQGSEELHKKFKCPRPQEGVWTCFTSRKVWGSLLFSLKKSQKTVKKIDFWGHGGQGSINTFFLGHLPPPRAQKSIFLTVFCDFFSENKSDPQTFLEVKQDR